MIYLQLFWSFLQIGLFSFDTGAGCNQPWMAYNVGIYRSYNDISDDPGTDCC